MSEELNGKCISCNIELELYRDGTIEEGFRCHNCYWEQEGLNMRKKDVPDIILPDYRKKKNKKIYIGPKDE
tara:strand:+ start:570 stop:782 length:213 start_codon:yes stop_codon:yes gene_type:complete